MLRRLSARALITLTTIAILIAFVVLNVAVVRDALSDSYAAAIPETIAALWTVAVFLIVLAGIVVWALTGRLLQPITDLRRDLALAARTRAVAEAHTGELEEVRLLRSTLASVLQELETRSLTSETEQYRLLGLFEAITEGIVQVGPGGRFVHANAAARSLLNLPAHVERQTAASLIRNLDLREVVEHAAEGKPVAATEIEIDGRQLLISPHPLPRSRGENAGAVITVVDLTELRRLESVRRDFVANVSHELKTPLTSIRGYAETLLSEEMPREMQRQFLEVIYKNTTRIHRIVDDLLDLSRLQSGGWQPDLHDVEAEALARDVWTTCEQPALQKHISFEVVGGPATVRADPGGLRQVFANLFDNAIRYTADGGRVRVSIKPSVEARAGKRGWIEIEVRDDGTGIPYDALPRVFERFYRVDPARSRAEGGTGLGLSIVKHLVERMSGDVVAESEIGKGTAIRLRLPAAA
jgi:signal transduction histidine kinase